MVYYKFKSEERIKTMVEDFDLMMKVIVVGNGQVGKTCLITRFAKNTFSMDYKKTLGVDYL